MKTLNAAIDRFCATHPRFGIPKLMLYIVGANLVTYFLDILSHSALSYMLVMDAGLVLRGELWRLVTYVLLPTSGGIGLLISCVFYYWLGTTLESIWGTAKFTIYYLSGALLSSLSCLLVYFIDRTSFSLYGAGYVNSALFFAVALYNPEAIVRLFYIIPIKMKWLAWFEAAGYAVLTLSALFAKRWGMALMPVVALLNFAVYFSPFFQRKVDSIRAHNRPQAIQFRKAVREQRRQRGYNHKCSVCGKTDADYPNLQFRYCSKCQGYHCYCEEHIFNHVHFTE